MRIEDINEIFTYHSPTVNQGTRYVALRERAHKLALLINDSCPESREKALAITNLQQAIMWANASIAINEASTAK
jgi:hypothetical protein